MNLAKHTLYLLLILVAQRGEGQGLGFYNNDNEQDRRTNLNVTAEKPLIFPHNTELTFDLSYLPGYQNSFGYVLRLVRNNTQNIDLLFDKVNFPEGHFRAVVGDKPPFASFILDSNRMFEAWNTIRLSIDFTHDRLLLYVGKACYIQPGMHLSPTDSFRISFGACTVPQFKTGDVPPMKIRNVQITSEGRLLYHWPLDEDKGGTAAETERGLTGLVQNPLWIKSTHSQWRLIDSLVIDGAASCAFDARHSLLYLVGRDSVTVYALPGGRVQTIPYETRQYLLAGNQSLYDPFVHQLYNLYPDQQLVSAFDFNTRRWDKAYLPGDINYWHVNKFASALDTSIYVLNGYGHMKYKNTVFRYHIPTRTWERIDTKGDTLTPRYLAAAGATAEGDTLYVLGGRGSSSGEQIMNARNLYDLLRFDVRTRTFERRFALAPGEQDFAFANSLVIDEHDRSYYGLLYNNQEFHSHLQLIKGSLDMPLYTALAGQIPYPFHDIHSFTDLYYSPVTRQFVAVIFFEDSSSTGPSHTSARIYSLDAPAEPATVAMAEAPAGRSVFWYFLLPVGLVGLFLLLRPAKKRVHAAPSVSTAVAPHPSASIFLFGDLQVFDAEGTDLTKQFSPLLKQLFLLILLYSIKNEHGIGSEKLDEILWFDKTEKSARNNRSVNIGKLKALLDRIGGCDLSKETGYWKITLDPGKVYVDYLRFHTLHKNEASALVAIIKRGSLLTGVEYPWLDAFKSDVSNRVIDTLLHFVKHGNPDPDFLLEITDSIFFFDPVNEDAMILKCKTLVQLGKHSLAKQAYTSFVKEYQQLYGENFKKDFQSILNASSF
ncbi:Kelch repeat-containing protein [Dinghuibacter silviterrae]|uniref:Galactose oxidase-like protein n=1 Tax=Dinghuibacter silviterrae TaxID=1539049 RepID=A0A4R8DUL6_9BACT|nr:kelch repeat-containing protein [Dinghuibacter silviterrae]TDX02064.1 galactose oxidase-like protein [Dinghuibacter silviterrae]